MNINHESEHIKNIDDFVCTNLVDWGRLNEVNAIMLAKSDTQYMVIGGIALRYAISKSTDFASFATLCGKLCQRRPTMLMRAADSGVVRTTMRQQSVVDSWQLMPNFSDWDKVYQVYFSGSNLIGGRNIPELVVNEEVTSQGYAGLADGTYQYGSNSNIISDAMRVQPWAYATFPVYLDYQTTADMLDVAMVEAATAGAAKSEAESKMRDIISETKSILGDIVNYQPYLLADYMRVGDVSGFGNLTDQVSPNGTSFAWNPRVYPDGLVLPSCHLSAAYAFSDGLPSNAMQATLTRANINGIPYANIVAGIERASSQVITTEWTTQTLLDIAINKWRGSNGVEPTIEPLAEEEPEGTNYQRALDNHIAEPGVLGFHPGENSLPGGASMTWCVLTAVADGTVSGEALADVFSYTYTVDALNGKLSLNNQSIADGHSARKTALDVLINGG